jgi:hypothetical protein
VEACVQWKEQGQCTAAGMEQIFAIHVIHEKKDKSLARALMKSLLASTGFALVVSLEFHQALCFHNDNRPAEHLKLLELLRNHKHDQDKITSTMIPDLLSMDVHAPSPPPQSKPL